MGDLLELAARVEQGDTLKEAELLSDAYAAIFPIGGHRQHGLTGPQSDRQRARFFRMIEAGAYLDAAITLVPEGWLIRIKQTSKYDQRCFTGDAALAKWIVSALPDTGKPDDFFGYVHGCAATPTLALCAAALRARAQSSTQQESEL